MNIYSQTDVLVVGGGTAGLIAAVAASRNGAQCLIVDQYGYLGGTMTASLLPHSQTFHAPDGRQIIKGIPQELFDRLSEANGAIGHLKRPPYYWATDSPYDAEVFKSVADDWVEQENIDVLFHTFASEPILQGQDLRGIIIQNKSGRQLVLADIVIDSTGDGDIAAMAGAPYKQGREEDGSCQGVSFQFQMANVDLDRTAKYLKKTRKEAEKMSWGRLDSGVIGRKLDSERESYVRLVGTLPDIAMETENLDEDIKVFTIESIREGVAIIGHPHILNVDATNTKSLTEAEIKGRRKLHKLADAIKKYIPGFEKSFVIQTPPQIGVRETRRIMGLYELTAGDIREGKKFHDTIALGAFPLDIHSTAKLGESDTVFEQIQSEYGIPYRCLVPQNLDNILVCGRCVSADRAAQASLRVTPTCMAMGQAAGTAAAMCSQIKTKPRELDIDELQKKLTAQGAMLE